MQIELKSGDICASDTDAVVVGFFEDSQRPGQEVEELDKVLNGTISKLRTAKKITGKLSEMTEITSLGNIAPDLLLVAGLGKKGELTTDRIRGVTGEICRLLRRNKIGSVSMQLLGAGAVGIKEPELAQAMVEGALLGLYVFHKHRSTMPEQPEIEKITIYASLEVLPELEDAILAGRVISEAVNTARDMVNEPSNYMTPADMVETAKQLVAESEKRDSIPLQLGVFERQDMQELGMGALLGVAKGSDEPPKFMVLNYKGATGEGVDLALVGKAITFDSGGISIKPSEKMEEMKGDMAGGASVLAAISAIARLGVKLNVAAVVSATENLPSGHAYKPGDVLKAMNGKTIEVISTDAEGRLALADALSYTEAKIKPRYTIDVATLTGACVIALGNISMAVFSKDKKLADQLIAAAARAGERAWQMPLFEEYREQNKSDVADVKNVGGRPAGAITAAMFLSEFTGSSWAHLDIAGVSMTDKEKNYNPKGATGVPVRTLINVAVGMASSESG
jgi:leucyl aminopeptidase